MNSKPGGSLSAKRSKSNWGAKVHLLEQHGPVLPRPHSDVIVTSKHSNMKELRGKVVFPHRRAELRVLYAFDPRRSAILLIGGDKKGNPKWYEEYVPIADQLFDAHLREIEREEKKRREEKREEKKRG